MGQCEIVTDLDDPRLGAFRDLRQRRSQRGDGRVIAEGQLVVQRLLASPLSVETVVVEAGRHRWAEDWTDRCTVLELGKSQIRELAGFDFHRGVLASAERPPQRILHADAITAAESPLLFVCGVSDPENLGSIIRSATAFGVTDIAHDRTTADPLATRVLRVSMGTAFKQRFWWSDDVAADVRRLAREAGYRTVATTLKPGARTLNEFCREIAEQRSRLALLVGSEAAGLPQTVEEAVTDRVMIPMRRQTDSLNVAVATGIVLHALA
jgi:tRNA G18 (ribose-2'-O)-methylase SpoU